MAEASTIARPYAQAAFEVAQESKALESWSQALGFVAAVVADPQMRALVGNPKLTPAQLADVLFAICGDRLDKTQGNFIRLLIENRRLALLPEIAARFDALRAEAEKVVNVQLVSAVEVDKATQKKIANALKKRLGQSVNLSTAIDERIIGGAIIRAGDFVIDGSVAGQLDRLASELTH